MTIICPLPQDISFNHNFYKLPKITKEKTQTSIHIIEQSDNSLERKLQNMSICTKNKIHIENILDINKSNVYNSLERKLENMSLCNKQNKIHKKKKQRINKYHIENILKRKFDQIKL
tara:strand:- start:1749 stop:2099 length:351 start_codon:yes stop_codon:yes gene_type:complete